MSQFDPMKDPSGRDDAQKNTYTYRTEDGQSYTNPDGSHGFIYTPEEERRERETEAVLNKWRARTYTERAKRDVVCDIKEHLMALMIAGCAIAVWVTALLLMMGAAIR